MALMQLILQALTNSVKPMPLRNIDFVHASSYSGPDGLRIQRPSDGKSDGRPSRCRPIGGGYAYGCACRWYRSVPGASCVPADEVGIQHRMARFRGDCTVED